MIERLWKTRQNSIKSKFQGCNLIVKNLPKILDEKDLRNMFKQHGEISSVKIGTQGVFKEIVRNGEVVDKEFIYESKGYGYVCFINEEGAKEVTFNLK